MTTPLCNECGKRGFLVCSGKDDCTHPRACPSCAGQGSVRVINTRGEPLLYGCSRCVGGKVSPADARRPRCPQKIRIDGGPFHQCVWAEGHGGRHGFDPKPGVAAGPAPASPGPWSRDLVLANLRRSKRVVGGGSFAEQITGSAEHRDTLNAVHIVDPRVGGTHPTSCGDLYDSELSAFAAALNDLGVPAVLVGPCENWQAGRPAECSCPECEAEVSARVALCSRATPMPKRVPVASVAIRPRLFCPVDSVTRHRSFFEACEAVVRYPRPEPENP